MMKLNLSKVTVDSIMEILNNAKDDKSNPEAAKKANDAFIELGNQLYNQQ